MIGNKQTKYAPNSRKELKVQAINYRLTHTHTHTHTHTQLPTRDNRTKAYKRHHFHVFHVFFFTPICTRGPLSLFFIKKIKRDYTAFRSSIIVRLVWSNTARARRCDKPSLSQCLVNQFAGLRWDRLRIEESVGYGVAPSEPS